MRRIYLVAMGVCFAVVACRGATPSDALALLQPAPQRVVRTSGMCGGDAVSVVRAAVPEAPAAVADQAYILKIEQSVEIIAGGEAGERYARATLEQLRKLSGGALPTCTITDWPALKWRGYMNDCGRNYLDMDAIKAILDVMAAYKMNLFHWHLSDNHGWRLESKKYPQLNRPGAFARQAGKFYTQDDFREIVRSAAERGITVMPELDVPGHSAAFRRGMGRTAMSEPGTEKIVSELFEELCSLADAKTMPFIHIGTDEARKPEEKVDDAWPTEWAGTVNAAGRTAVVWRPGLPIDSSRDVVDMVWNDRPKDLAGLRNPFFCASRLYNAEWTPFEVLTRAAFTKPCRWSAPEGCNLGAITCTWHDANVGDDVRQLFRECMVFPSIVAMADNFWHGVEKDDPANAAVMPKPGTDAFTVAERLERRMLAQRDIVLKDFRYPFPFFAQTHMRWRVRDCKTGDVLRRDVASGTIWLKTDPECDWRDRCAVAPDAKGPVAVEAWVKSPREVKCGAWIDLSGMDGLYARLRMPSRPKEGRWNRYNARVELNGEILPSPKWRNPGTNDVAVTGAWGSPEMEIPLVDEMPGLREPYPIRLKRGWNHICITTAAGRGKWDLSVVSFSLFTGTTAHPQEVKGLEWRSDPPERPDGAVAQGMSVGWATAAEKIRPRTAGKVLPISADGLKVRLARNEYESVQVLVSPKTAGLKDVKVSVDGDLYSGGGVFGATNVSCEVVGYVYANPASRHIAGHVVVTNNALGYVRRSRRRDVADVGWWPDPILRFLDHADVKVGDVQSFWVRVHCPERQAVGTYRGAIVVSAQDVPDVRIPFAVRVNDFSIGRTPPTPVLVTFRPWFGHGTANAKTRKMMLSDATSPQNAWRRHETEWCDFLADYFITIDNLYGGDVRFDLMERLKAQGRLGHFNLGYWNCPNSTNAADIAVWRKKTIPGIRKTYKEAKLRGLLDRAILFGCDEAHANWFPAIREAVCELKAEFPDVPLVTTARDWKRYGVNSPLAGVDWFVPGAKPEYYNPAKAAVSRAQGRKVLWYGDPEGPYANLLVETDAIDFRQLVGVQSVRMETDGYLYYTIAQWGANRCIESGPFTRWNPHSYNGLNGNGSWVCCGPDGTPLATIRLENFRDGLEDLWYAKILGKKLNEIEKEGKAPVDWMSRARMALAVPREVMDTMANFNNDPAVLYRWRDAMADLIEMAD